MHIYVYKIKTLLLSYEYTYMYLFFQFWSCLKNVLQNPYPQLAVFFLSINCTHNGSCVLGVTDQKKDVEKEGKRDLEGREEKCHQTCVRFSLNADPKGRFKNASFSSERVCNGKNMC